VSCVSSTHDAAAFICHDVSGGPHAGRRWKLAHVISAVVMPKSLPAKLDMTVIEPVRKLDMATAIVTDMTKRHSCNVDLKHVGRAFGSLSLIGGEVAQASGASFSGSSGMLKSCHGSIVFSPLMLGPNALVESRHGDGKLTGT
jgi:hypothetical protein